jgi:hypothetical protein
MPDDAAGELPPAGRGLQREQYEAEDGDEPAALPTTEEEHDYSTDERGDEEADEDDSPWSHSRVARLRSAAGPLIVTLGAAALAFLGIRAIAGNGWQTLRAALQAPVSSPPDAGTARDTAARVASGPEVGSDDADLLSEQRKVPVNVTVDSELLDLPPHTKLRPGHGLLEVRTWERQQIYVDGVFMGNYENRLIPLGPGTYQLRLRDGARDIERPVVVEAGRRTRLRAQPKSSK